MSISTCSRQAATALAAAVILIAVTPSIGWTQEQLPWQATTGQTNKAPAVSSAARMNAGANDAYRSRGDSDGASSPPANDSYRPAAGGSSNGSGAYSPPADENAPVDQYGGRETGPNATGDGRGYGAPYSPPPQTYDDANRGEAPTADPRHSQGFEQNEILGAGHRFFGSISGGIANGIEWAFKSQGRPNGYILGEDAGGALLIGLRYGEGTLYTKDAGEHRVFWQGPSIGYDAGGDGSKTMVLVYNMRDPSEIYERFGGVQGAAYLVGGVSVQIQKYNDVTLAVIRSGVGLRLGANVGYMKYTRSPTWNPL